MNNDIVGKILTGASLRCVMQPSDEIPTNRPLHDECFDLPHIIVDGEKFSAITGRDIVIKPGIHLPIVFYYTNYKEIFGTFAPVEVEPGFSNNNNLMRVSLCSRKRYNKFEWLPCCNYKKIWDFQGAKDIETIRSAVLQATLMKVVFLDEEDIWNIHPVILPQVACNENTFLLQTCYITYPLNFRNMRTIETHIDTDEECRAYFEDDKCSFTGAREAHLPAFHAFYHLHNDGTYKSYYDLDRGDTLHEYKQLMVFAEE